MRQHRVLVLDKRFDGQYCYASKVRVVSTHVLARDAHREAARVGGWVAP